MRSFIAEDPPTFRQCVVEKFDKAGVGFPEMTVDVCGGSALAKSVTDGGSQRANTSAWVENSDPILVGFVEHTGHEVCNFGRRAKVPERSSFFCG